MARWSSQSGRDAKPIYNQSLVHILGKRQPHEMKLMNSMQAPQPMGMASEGQDDDSIDLGALLRGVWRFKWGVLGLAFSVALIAGLVVFAMQPIYEGTATLELETDNANLVGIEEIYELAGGGQREYVTTQMEILQSRDVAERVVTKLRLHEHPVYQPDALSWWQSIDFSALLPASRQVPPEQLTPEAREAQRINAVTTAVMENVSVQPVRNSRLAVVNFESTSPALAAQVANALVTEFINRDLQNRLSGTTQATGWLEDRLGSLRRELSIAERALQDFRVREGLVDVEGKTSLGSNELTLLNTRLEEARRTRIAAQNIRDEVQTLGGTVRARVDDLMSIPAVLNHMLVRDVKLEQNAARRDLAELSKTYGLKHPKIIAATQRLESADRNLVTEVRKVVSGIEREYDFAARSEAQLTEDWEARRLEVQDFNRKEFELRALQRDVDTNRELLDVFFARLKAVNETGGFEQPHARMVDRAMVPVSPVAPNKQLTILLALILGGGLGCGIAIVLHRLDNAIRTPDDVAERLHAPLLGTLPKVEGADVDDIEDRIQASWEKAGSGFSEAMRTIRTGIVLSSLDTPAKVIVVTSSVPGEGKSTAAVHIAQAFGQMERTLLIGADLRRPSLARRLSLDKNTRGLSHLVAGTASIDESVTALPERGFDVVPSGVIPPNPLELISSTKFLEVLEEFKTRYDRVIVDSAPVGLVSDGLILASYADSVIFVVKADSTPATVAQRNLANIIASNEPLAGVVLNMFDPNASSGYYGRDRYGGAYNYGYSGYGYGGDGYSDYTSHESR